MTGGILVLELILLTLFLWSFVVGVRRQRDAGTLGRKFLEGALDSLFVSQAGIFRGEFEDPPDENGLGCAVPLQTS